MKKTIGKIATLSALVGALSLGSCSGAGITTTQEDAWPHPWPVGERDMPRTTQTFEDVERKCGTIVLEGMYGYICLDSIFHDLIKSSKKYLEVRGVFTLEDRCILVEILKSSRDVEESTDLNLQLLLKGYIPPSVDEIVDYALLKEKFRKTGIRLQLKANDSHGEWTLETNGLMTALVDTEMIKKGLRIDEQKAAYHLEGIKRARIDFMRNTAPIGDQTEAINKYIRKMDNYGVVLTYKKLGE